MYLFSFRLAKQATVTVGRLGTFVFDSGWYIYTGSAMGSLRARLLRHYRGPVSGKLHWHIDYIAGLGSAKSFKALVAGLLSECELNAAVGALAGAGAPVAGFGSSDCACNSHLHLLPGKLWPAVDGLRVWKPEELQ